MHTLAAWSWTLDGWIVAAGVLCAVSSALLGNFLVLRRMSLLGDAISHAVLPGLAAAFFISGSRSSFAMFAGAVVVGVLTALFTQWIRGIGRVDEGASMGVVFTSLFAIGLVMIVQAADHVDLDPGCVLYGAIEFTPLDRVLFLGHEIPRAVVTLSLVALVNAIFVLVFYKELKITSFDPTLATTIGFRARSMHYLLVILVATTAVASFESVGNILVVAMLIVPPAAAYLLTDRLATMIGLSVVLAAAAAVLGHFAALIVPSWFGYQSTTTAGMMAVAAGFILLVAASLGPRHGVIVRLARRRILAWNILAEDVIGLLFRIRERGQVTPATARNLQEILLADPVSIRIVLSWLMLQGQVKIQEGAYALTDAGSARAQGLVRSHRLWEQYLSAKAGFGGPHLHEQAERLEHFTDRQLRDQLHAETDNPQVDPHGRPIPPEQIKGG